VNLLETGHASVDQIAVEAGFAEGITLRVLLKKLGCGVREVRRLFDAARKKSVEPRPLSGLRLCPP